AGIRYWSVTGVQTCARPISARAPGKQPTSDGHRGPTDRWYTTWRHRTGRHAGWGYERWSCRYRWNADHAGQWHSRYRWSHWHGRSEERRVGKEGRSRGCQAG